MSPDFSSLPLGSANSGESGFVRGWELVANTDHENAKASRLCVMNLFLHGVDGDPCPIEAGADSLAGDPGERFEPMRSSPSHFL